MHEGSQVRALSLHRPWGALMLLDDGKDIENRGWTTRYRGLVALHNAIPIDDGGYDYAWRILGLRPSEVEPGPAKAFIGVATLVHVCTISLKFETRDGSVPCNCGPWAMPGQAHWHMRDRHRLPVPISRPGRQGLYRAPDDVVLAIQTAGLA